MFALGKRYMRRHTLMRASTGGKGGRARRRRPSDAELVYLGRVRRLLQERRARPPNVSNALCPPDFVLMKDT